MISAIAGSKSQEKVKEKAETLYKRVNWEWYRDKETNYFYMGYKPEKGFWGHWDMYAEQLIMYVLGVGSPTFPIDKNMYYDFERKKADTLVSMKKAEIPISWYFEKDGNERVKNAGFDMQNIIDNRQVNKEYYIPNGAIYILDYEVLKKDRTYYTNNTVTYIMSNEESIDIDTKYEFEFAEFLARR